MTPESVEPELRRQLLAERFGPVAALVLERVLTAAEGRHCATSGRDRGPSMSAAAGRVTTSRGGATG
ncbi:MAG TPA: hypothetical protein VHN80_05335 [Kineosporiaceae bacterium]|nr:hypothetical protein [Kineosporiaceae bacterium]